MPSAYEATRLISDTKRPHGSVGLLLHKFLCNSIEVVQKIPQEDLAKGFEDPHEALPVERPIGDQWCMENDSR